MASQIIQLTTNFGCKIIIKRGYMKKILKVLTLAGAMFWQAQASAETGLSVEQLLPQYITWAQKTNNEGLQQGGPLNKRDLLLAKKVGIKFPEKVRIIFVDTVPYPIDNPALKAMGESLGFIGEGIVNQAQAFGYSIYVRKDYELDRPRLAHELVHVLQIERSNFASVVIQYASDIAKYGYENSPLEAEAFKANIKYATD